MKILNYINIIAVKEKAIGNGFRDIVKKMVHGLEVFVGM